VRPAAAPEGPPCGLLLGFSGGGDSTALLLHLRAQGLAFRALIVDHGLRPAARTEAARALAFAHAHGVDATCVRLELAGQAGGQAAWRRARLLALLAYARAHGCGVIALGHTADDQAETIALRLSAGSGWRGLAGMAALCPAPLWPEGHGVRLWRPLLHCTRATLRSRLHAAGAAWTEDPSNTDPRFARVRLRALLAAQPPLHTSLIETGRAAARTAACIDRAALTLLRTALQEAAETAALRWEPLLAAPTAIAARALAAALTAVGAQQRPPDDARAMALLQRALDAARPFTAFGVRLAPAGPLLRLTRDPGAVHARAGRAVSPTPLAPGQPLVWDARALLHAEDPGWSASADARGRLRVTQAAQSAAATPAPAAQWLTQTRIAQVLWRGAAEDDGGACCPAPSVPM
jgi:tRNA(Ile)-lysidine synthase